jgi:hypothetical protein
MEELKCNECGTVGYSTGYMDGSTKRTMDEQGVCFNCAFWINQSNRKDQVVIDGLMYWIGKGGGGGMAGRSFDIQMDDGRLIETNDLWHQGTIPYHFKERMPDNATFMNGACKGGYAWSPSVRVK